MTPVERALSARTCCACAKHRDSGACANKATILLQVLEQEFLSALDENLRRPDLRGELTKALSAHMKAGKASATTQDRVDQERAEIESTRKSLTFQTENLIRAIREMGHSRALLADLAQLEARIARLDEALASVTKPPAKEVSDAEIRNFVDSAARSFTDILAGAPEAVRHSLQQRITYITLTPSVDERGKVYTVSGDVDLFSVSEDVVQTNHLW